MADLAAQIDLSRHGVIEAHAGTGKTFTIVQLVLRILKEFRHGARVHIRDILLVTYTEKAAGELKRRIREGILDAITIVADAATAPDAALQAHLQDCLNNLHEAYIGTIHGICLRLLQHYPFETGVRFETELIDDVDGLKRQLRESMRVQWNKPDTQIPWALVQLQLQGSALYQKDLDQIVAIAQELLDEQAIVERKLIGGHDLESLKKALHQTQEHLQHFDADFIKLMKLMLENIAEVSAVSATISSDARAILTQRVELIIEKGPLFFVNDILKLDKYYKPDKNGKLRLTAIADAKARKDPGNQKLLQSLDAAIAHPLIAHIQQREVLLSWVKLTLLCDASEILRNEWIASKRAKGLLSFHDMLAITHTAMHRNPALCQALRSRIQFGIIDEFQDTSTLQWEIFEKLFIKTQGGNQPRLYLVGDPKQSIYSFQGADVYSYLRARSIITQDAPMLLYVLEHNYRSLPATIQGYNGLLSGSNQPNNNWFMMHEVAYSGAMIAKAPKRSKIPIYEKPDWLEKALEKPVQVIPLNGNAAKRRRDMAKVVVQAVQALVGRAIMLPCGEGWNKVVLEYGHCAVIVESHSLAQPFMDAFSLAGIPYSKYKLGGFFQSVMAIHFRTLLAAIANHDQRAECRISALLTLFFNRNLSSLDLDKELSSNGDLESALDQWMPFVQYRNWAGLFRSILTTTQIQQRLLMLADGDRSLADLQQLISYAHEQLALKGMSLSSLVAHLRNLELGTESSDADTNLFTLQNSKSSVQILTMHTAKGLEFPIVFLMPGGSKKTNHDLLRWTDTSYRKHIMPFEKLDAAIRKAQPDVEAAYELARLQSAQERKRLLYVAITRPQALLFVPMQEDDTAWADEDLTPALRYCLQDAGSHPHSSLPMCLFAPTTNEWQPLATNIPLHVADSLETLAVSSNQRELIKRTATAVIDRLVSLDLRARWRLQLSYTSLSKTQNIDRDIDKSQEPLLERLLDNENALSSETLRGESVLPRSKHTGMAMHEILEWCLGQQDLQWAHTQSVPDAVVTKTIERLDYHRVLSDRQPLNRSEAIQMAVRLIKKCLGHTFMLPNGESFCLVNVLLADRRAEVSFQGLLHRDWLSGFMDVVVRVNECYYIIDWKTNSLDQYDQFSIEQSIQHAHYDLQAKMYSYALHCFLSDALGKAYNPKRHLGCALYVYMRSFETQETSYTWVYQADPYKDKAYVEELVQRVHSEYAMRRGAHA